MSDVVPGWRHRLSRWWQSLRPGLQVGRFIQYNRKKWPRRSRRSSGTVLISLTPLYPTICSYSVAANHLARVAGAAIETFSFRAYESPLITRIYRSFGARHGLGVEQLKPFQKQAEAEAEKVFAGLKTKADVENIAIDGLVIGDLIYDTYLRLYAEATLKLTDPRLKHVIAEAFSIYHASRDYFARRKPVAVLPDHLVYTHSGIVVRLAVLAGVPVYLTYFWPRFYLHRQPPAEGDPHALHPGRWRYWLYREDFSRLDPERRQAGLLKAREMLRSRLSGVADHTLGGKVSAYSGTSAGRVLSTSSKPKILVMLHDFCDAVHGYRDFLFPDFYEWIYFLLERAVATDFEWYVKPHPNNHHRARAAMNAANDAVVEELRRKFPAVTFLAPTASNRQLVDEGLTAMFTGRGTAGHEFAYLGIPVVNAGDNPHIAYSFNIHAATTDELADCIRRADALQVQIDPGEIEEFFYMNYLYPHEEHGAEVHPINPTIPLTPDTASNPELFNMLIDGSSEDQNRKMTAYFDALVRKPIARELVSAH